MNSRFFAFVNLTLGLVDFGLSLVTHDWHFFFLGLFLFGVAGLLIYLEKRHLEAQKRLQARWMAALRELDR